MNWLDNSETVKLYRRLRYTYVPHGQFQPNSFGEEDQVHSNEGPCIPRRGDDSDMI